jgi:hypothetical protein
MRRMTYPESAHTATTQPVAEASVTTSMRRPCAARTGAACSSHSDSASGTGAFTRATCSTGSAAARPPEFRDHRKERMMKEGP